MGDVAVTPDEMRQAVHSPYESERFPVWAAEICERLDAIVSVLNRQIQRTEFGSVLDETMKENEKLLDKLADCIHKNNGLTQNADDWERECEKLRAALDESGKKFMAFDRERYELRAALRSVREQTASIHIVKDGRVWAQLQETIAKALGEM